MKCLFYHTYYGRQIQLLDLCVSHSFKHHYRKNFVRKTLKMMDEGKCNRSKTDVLQDIYFVVLIEKK